MRALLGSLLVGMGTVVAAPPTLDSLYPAGGSAGSEFVVTATGKLDPWPVQVWCSAKGVSFTPEKDKGKFKVTIAPEAPKEPCLVRFHNSEGVSAVRTFVVSGGPELLEEGKHGTASEAQPIPSLPMVVNGRLERNGNIDFFRVGLKKGQTLTAQVDCYALGTMADPFLHLLDARGYEVALASMSRNLDPLLTFQAPADGDYVLQIAAIEHPPSTSVNFTSGDEKVYRLNLTTEPPRPRVEPSVREAAPSAEIQALAVPARLEGTLAKRGEVDRYQFTAAKGQNLLVRVEAQRLNSPIDGVLKVTRPDGNLFKSVDDVKPYADPEFVSAFPLDGAYQIEVSDRFQRGGPGFIYHLVVEEAKPDFKVTADQQSYLLKVKETVSLKLKVERQNGHKAPLRVNVEGLPAGVTFAPPEVPEKTGDVTLELKSAAEAAAFSGPIRVQVMETEGDAPLARSALFSLQDQNARGDYLINEVEDLWLTVAIPAPEPEKAAK